MSPEKLSELLRVGEIYPIVSYNIWCKLIGKLITCPICSKKAIIVPFGLSLPMEKVRYIPCHCSISLGDGVIVNHWCANDECIKRSQNHPFRSFWDSWDIGWDNGVDVCKSFGELIKDSHRI